MMMICIAVMCVVFTLVSTTNIPSTVDSNSTTTLSQRVQLTMHNVMYRLIDRFDQILAKAIERLLNETTINRSNQTTSTTKSLYFAKIYRSNPTTPTTIRRSADVVDNDNNMINYRTTTRRLVHHHRRWDGYFVSSPKPATSLPLRSYHHVTPTRSSSMILLMCLLIGVMVALLIASSLLVAMICCCQQKKSINLQTDWPPMPYYRHLSTSMNKTSTLSSIDRHSSSPVMTKPPAYYYNDSQTTSNEIASSHQIITLNNNAIVC